jgi:hypothetical protein
VKPRETPQEPADLSAENMPAATSDAANTAGSQAETQDATDRVAEEQTAKIEKLSKDQVRERYLLVAEIEAGQRKTRLMNTLHMQRMAGYGINAILHSAASAVRRHHSDHPDDRDH